jgi:hypothetical protein
VAAETQEGDEVWLLRGGRLFYILLRQEGGVIIDGQGDGQTLEDDQCSEAATRENDEHLVVGEPFLHGLMNGELDGLRWALPALNVPPSPVVLS